MPTPILRVSAGLALLLSAFMPQGVQAQEQAADTLNALQASLRHVEGRAEVQGVVNNGFTPLWMAANRYGLSCVEGNYGLLRGGVFHDTRHDVARRWRIGYGLDIAFTIRRKDHFKFYIQQAYADFEYKKVRLSVGSKERPAQLKNNELSSGAQTLGINARPIPEVRIELPEYLRLWSWGAVKGHFGYGMMTDGKFQRSHVAPGVHYARHAFYHSKAAYVRLGNEARFPLTFEGGLEMACEFGGTIYNPLGSTLPEIKMPSGIKEFFKAIYGGGSDATDGVYSNAGGNTVGSWLLSLKYHGKGWDVRAYYDRFFEDHSQMFPLIASRLDDGKYASGPLPGSSTGKGYGYRDGLWGIEVTLPRNPAVTSVVYEHVSTAGQSGPIYHDHTAALPDQVSAADNFYNHNLYQGWQHWGQAIGNPLFLSPLYNGDSGSLEFTANRFRANHFGLSGDPLPTLHYRALLSYITSWGTYNMPFDAPRHAASFLLEARWSPEKLGRLCTKGWSLQGAFAFDRGSLTGNNTGFQLSLRKKF